MPETLASDQDALSLQLLGVDDRVRLWSKRRARALEFMHQFQGKWAEYWAWYRNWRRPFGDELDWWRTNDAIPTPFKIIETLMPRYVVGMYSDPEWLKVQANKPELDTLTPGTGLSYELMCESLLRTCVEESGLFPKMNEAIRYATIMGHVWGKCVWREEYNYQRVLSPMEDGSVDETVFKETAYDGPDFEWLPLDRVFADPSGRGEWYIEDIETTLDALLDEQEGMSGSLYDDDQLRALEVFKGSASVDTPTDMPTGGVGAAQLYDHAREPQFTEGIPNYMVSPSRDGVGVRLWQCWGRVPRSMRATGVIGGSDVTLDAWRLVVIAEGKFVLRDDPAPTPDGRPPYFPIKSLPIPNRLYGESILAYVGPLSDQQAKLSSMRVDEVYLGIFQQYMIAQQKVLSDNQTLISPGGWVQLQLEPGQGVNDIFGVVPRRPVMPEAWNEDQYRQTQAEHVSAATDVMQGVSASGRQTATEITSRLQQGNARHVLQTMWFNYTVSKELMTRYWKWLRMRLVTPKLVRMQGQNSTSVDLSMLDTPIDIIVGGGFYELSRVNRVEMIQQVVTLAQNPAFVQVMRLIPALHRLLQEIGWKNTQQFVKTQEEFDSEQQEERELQLTSVMGGAQGVGGEPSSSMPQVQAMPNMPGEGPDAGLAGQPLGGNGIYVPQL